MTSHVDTLFTWLLDHHLIIVDVDRLKNYLIRYDDLIGILRSACQAALERFGVQSELSLEMYADPEIADEYPTLYIRQDPYSESILKSLEDLRVTYEVGLRQSPGWFLMTTDFRQPSSSSANADDAP